MMPEDYPRFSREQRRRFWQQHVEGWQQSGLIQSAYCRRRDLNPYQFYRWRRRIMIKFLYWDRNGFALWHKRLDKQRFQWPTGSDTSAPAAGTAAAGSIQSLAGSLSSAGASKSLLGKAMP
jgi:hypothetical protein